MDQASGGSKSFFDFPATGCYIATYYFWGRAERTPNPLPVAHNVLVSDRPDSRPLGRDGTIAAANPLQDSAAQSVLSFFIERLLRFVCRLGIAGTAGLSA
jgi:hypothetical protein